MVARGRSRAVRGDSVAVCVASEQSGTIQKLKRSVGCYTGIHQQAKVGVFGLAGV